MANQSHSTHCKPKFGLWDVMWLWCATCTYTFSLHPPVIYGFNCIHTFRKPWECGVTRVNLIIQAGRWKMQYTFCCPKRCKCDLEDFQQFEMNWVLVSKYILWEWNSSLPWAVISCLLLRAYCTCFWAHDRSLGTSHITSSAQAEAPNPCPCTFKSNMTIH